jgi:hypothetical protein
MGHAVLGAVIAAARWDAANRAPVLLWLAALALALGLAWHFDIGRGAHDTGRRRIQAGWLGLGLAWSLGAVLLLPQTTPGQFGALALALACWRAARSSSARSIWSPSP